MTILLKLIQDQKRERRSNHDQTQEKAKNHKTNQRTEKNEQQKLKTNKSAKKVKNRVCSFTTIEPSQN